MKNKIISISIIAILAGFIISGCTNRNEEEYFQTEVVDTTQQDTVILISYQDDVAPIISANCAGCHQGGGQSGGIELNNYAQFSTNTDAVINSISRETAFMPQGGQKLPATKISLIETWKSQGKKDN